MCAATPGPTTSDGQALFQRDWQVYRKVLEHNYLHHHEAYRTLHDVLTNDFDRPFRFIDIACGDASASVGALAGTRVADYHGIDLSRPALDLARSNLEALACPVRLEEADFAAALARRTEPADVIWVGLSLHHLRADGKRSVLSLIRDVVAPDGVFLAYENTSPDGETREGWMARFDVVAAGWGAYDGEEQRRILDHVHGSDFPETDATWLRLGAEAGFAAVEQIYRSPDDLFRLYRFRRAVPSA